MIDYDTFYVTTVTRFEYPAGTLVVRQSSYDYGLANDDTQETGINHVTVIAHDKKGGFTIPERHLQYIGSTDLPMDDVLALVEEARKGINPEQKEPEPVFIEGKKVRPYHESYKPPVVGESAILFYGESMYRTSIVEKVDGTTVYTKNSVYALEND